MLAVLCKFETSELFIQHTLAINTIAGIYWKPVKLRWYVLSAMLEPDRTIKSGQSVLAIGQRINNMAS